MGLLKELFNFLVAIALATLTHERKAVACRYVKLFWDFQFYTNEV